MKTSSYKTALGVMATLCIGLAVAVAYLLVGRNHGAPSMQMPAGDPVIAKGPVAGTQHPDQVPAGTSVLQPALAPVQLSPQRMQEIGVTTAAAAVKTLSNDLEVPGNVEINELHAEAFDTRVFDESEWNWVEQVERHSGADSRRFRRRDCTPHSNQA